MVGGLPRATTTSMPCRRSAASDRGDARRGDDSVELAGRRYDEAGRGGELVGVGGDDHLGGAGDERPLGGHLVERVGGGARRGVEPAYAEHADIQPVPRPADHGDLEVDREAMGHLEVLSLGLSVTDVARRDGVTRQTVHAWLRRYASHGLAGLADGSAKPFSCPHQTTPQVEARVVMIRREPPGWGQRTILHELGREGVVPLPTLSSIYRCLIRA